MAMTAYQELLLDYVPRPVRNGREYRRTMRSIERLMRKSKLSRAESDLLELLATLAEQYESTEYPTPPASQADLLAHLIDARGTTQTELSRQTGIPCSVISSVLKRRRNLGERDIARLAKHFHVSPSEFTEGS
jgi:HTH-type transcriptional regulator/antitoxin HigA